MTQLLKQTKKHEPKKRFGQHFLQDEAVIGALLREIAPEPDDKMIEIGPGLGALTMPLLEKLKHLTAIEIDNHLYERWIERNIPKLAILHQDALTVNYGELGAGLRLVGNLPYNISTPLIFHFLEYYHAVMDMHFMLQKEVVSRMCAKPGCKAFGRLSVMVQYYCKVEHLFDVPPSAFNPPPKVDSSVIRLTPYTDRPYPDVDTHILKQVVACAFLTRRKTLANNLKSILPRTAIESLGIDPNKRPEQLSILEYVELAKIISNQGGYFEHLVQQE